MTATFFWATLFIYKIEKRRKVMKRVKLLSILLCLLVVFFPSCNGNSTSPEATGSITVKIEDSTTIGGGRMQEA